MKRSKQTKKALTSSVLALVLCFVMLLGTTFAWFTDTASTGVSTIQAGTLDIELQKYENGEWVTVKENEELSFLQAGSTGGSSTSDDSVEVEASPILWEPNCTYALPKLRVVNNGNLAVKFRVDVFAVTGDSKLAEVLEVVMTQDDLTAPVKDDASRMTLADVLAGDKDGVLYGTLDGKTGAADVTTGGYTIALHMRSTAGNEYQDKSIEGITLVVRAAQDTVEFDSISDQYDAKATFDSIPDYWDGTVDTDWYDDSGTEFTISTAEQLAGLSQLSYADGGNNFDGKTIKLTSDIDLSGQTWTPIKSFKGEFDGNDHTISNFVIEVNETNTRGGLFNIIEAGDGERVHDLTIKGVEATVANGRFGTLANSVKGIVNNVTVTDVKVTTTDKDAWVGGMCAFMSWPAMSDCTVENVEVNAPEGAAFIAGFACILQKNSNYTFTNCDVNGFKVTVSDTDGDCAVAGFAGQTQRGWENPSIKDCDVTGIDITASGTVDVAGFIAWPGAHTMATNCTTEGKINASGVTSTGDCVGGFFGNLGWNCDLGQMGHEITNCVADVDIISGGAPAGGFVGSATNSNNNSMYATFVSCTAKGDVTNSEGVAGGFAGVADRGDYDSCSASGTVTGRVKGGFIGQIKDVTPTYDSRYPVGTRDYNVDQIFIDDCTGSVNLDFIGQIDTGTDVTIDDTKQGSN